MGGEMIIVTDGTCRVSEENDFIEDIQFNWKIPMDWEEGQYPERSVKIALTPTIRESSKWEVGLVRAPNGEGEDAACNVYIMLTDAIDNCTVSACVHMNFDSLMGNFDGQVKGVFPVGEKVNMQDEDEDNLGGNQYFQRFVRYRGEIVVKVSMSILYEFDHPPEVSFMKNSLEGAAVGWTKLLDCPEFPNFTIVASDGREFRVNKHVIGASCPVFESMIRSQMVETVNSSVTVEDVGGAVMDILIRFWYTGQLAENWSSPGVIHELVYAAGKYTITELLEYLNNTLGNEKYGRCDINLLGIVKKLGLRRAESRITQTLVKKTANVVTSKELIEMYACACPGSSVNDNV